LLYTENAGHPSGYPDPVDHSNLYLLIGNSTVAVDESGRVDCAFSTDLASATDNNIAIAYQKWAGSSYAFDSPYNIRFLTAAPLLWINLFSIIRIGDIIHH
jgi:hypothetical protein